MTSNGNQSQKILINSLVETHPNPKIAFEKAIENSKNQEMKDCIKRIAKVFNIEI